MTQRDKRQRTLKFSGSTETQLAQLCHATGSGATAVVEQALASYYRDLFGQAALYRLATPEQTALEGAKEPSEHQAISFAESRRQKARV